MKERIIELAGGGTPAVAIASVVGCDPSYVSQLLADPEVAAQVGDLRAGRAVQRIEHDTKIQDLEKIALSRMETLLPMQTDLMKVTRVFQTLNAAKKSTDVGAGSVALPAGGIVTLELPAAAHLHFKLTADRQVIDIEGRSMVPMPSNMVAGKLRELKARRLIQDVEDAKTIPAISNRTKSIVDQL